MLGADWQVESMKAHPTIEMPEETGTTFEANALIKALSISQALPGTLVLADDSGLEVDALDGAPGVISARYAGEGATDKDNREKLKAELQASQKTPPFAARFRCCVVLALDDKPLHIAHGTVEGQVLLQEEGEGGFGYDALFIPEGHTNSFGVLPAETKNQLSHRARAIASLKTWLSQNSPV